MEVEVRKRLGNLKLGERDMVIVYDSKGESAWLLNTMDEIADKVREVDNYVFIEGGDLFYLLEMARKRWVDRVVILTDNPGLFSVRRTRSWLFKYFRLFNGYYTLFEGSDGGGVKEVEIVASRDWFIVEVDYDQLAFGIKLKDKYVLFNQKVAKKILAKLIVG